MKTFLLPVCLLYAICAHPQNEQNEFTSNGSQEKFVVKIKKDKTFVDGFRNNVNAKIFRSFKEKFGSPRDVCWVVDDKGVTAYFFYNNQEVAARYKKDGYHMSTRKVYDATNLDPGIIAFLHNELKKNYVVNLVTEIIAIDHSTYEISLQDDKHWLFLRIEKNYSQNRLSVIDRTLITKG